MSESFLETIKLVDGNFFHLQYHQNRYENVLTSIGSKNVKKLKEYLNYRDSGIYRCRVIYDKDNIAVEYYKYVKRDVKSLKLIYDDEITYLKKSINREKIDSLFKDRGICDDILIVKNSFITDTSIANIALYKDGLWFTPSNPLLKGTTRQRYIDNGSIIEKNIKVDELQNYTGVALLNAMIDFDIIAQDNIKDFFC